MATQPSSWTAEKPRKESGKAPGRGWPEKNGGRVFPNSPTASAQDIHRAPPHSVEAEQGVLGSMLISPRETIAECVERINEEYFYVPAHQTIYEVLVDLWNTSQAIDLITFTQVLRDRNLLETVGGASFVTSLFTFVPTAANVGYYLDIVRDKYILRQIIATSTESVRRAFEEQDEVNNLLDEVEQRIFSVGEDRFKGQMLSMKEQVMSTLESIEKLFENKGAITGLSTGFRDFDKLTSGLHSAEMIVIAARPSMGKCLAFDSMILLSDGSLATIEEVYQKQQARLLTLKENWKLDLASPSHFVDDGLKPVFRVATRLGKVVEATLPHPFLTISGWTKLARLKAGDRIAVPRKLNVFGRRRWRECEAKLLAYLIGDGCLTGSNPRFTSGNPIVRKEFAAAVVEFGGLKTHLFDSSGTRTPSFRVASNRELIRKGRLNFGATLSKAIVSSGQSSRQVALAAGVSPVSIHEWKKGNCVPTQQAFFSLCEVLESSPAILAPAGLEAISKNSRNSLTLWLDQLGIWGKDAHAKQIPAAVFTLVRPQLALFLNRLFATDGWATVLRDGQAQLGYATVSEELARQVQHLLLRFGVIASLRKRSVKHNSTRRIAWQLDITDKLSIQTFISEIGIFGKEKATEAVLRVLENRKYQTNRDLIPREIWVSIAENKGSESWAALARRAGIKGHTNIHVGQRSPTRQRLATLAAALKNESLRSLGESDVYWDEIVSIEPVGRKQVYDLTIPETHNFVANDICVHNTALAMNMAEHAAIQQKLPVAIFSLEMSAQQLVQRMLCSRARVNLAKTRDGFLAESDFPKLTSAASKLAEAKIFIDDSAGLSILELRAKARRLKAQQDVQLIVVDYLQLLRSTSRRAQDNRQLEISEISAGLKGLAKELKIPIIVVAQLNRNPEIRTGSGKGVPRLADLRESGSIEQDADLVGLLVREEYYADSDEERTELEGKAELIIAKQRNGPIGQVKLTFLKDFTRFEDRAEDATEPEEAF